MVSMLLSYLIAGQKFQALFLVYYNAECFSLAECFKRHAVISSTIQCANGLKRSAHYMYRLLCIQCDDITKEAELSIHNLSSAVCQNESVLGCEL